MNILLTGGAGYIGSHTAIVLSESGHKVVIFDNFSNSQKEVLHSINKIAGKVLTCIEGDVRDVDFVCKTLQDHQIEAVIHFAGLKAVGDSSVYPIEYFSNNVKGTISLLEAMNKAGVRKLVFSSSATVYGNPQYFPIDEKHPLGATNPYGRTKHHVEELLEDVANSDNDWSIICLRYFNPVGAHESGLIGEDPLGKPNNLMPVIAQVLAGELAEVKIFGNDYQTKDGTGVRDYIHVVDLANGHLAGISHLKFFNGCKSINLGTGNGYSVLELINAYESVSGEKINYQFTDRRPGDVAISFADAKKAHLDLNWTAKLTIQEMCKSSWCWVKKGRMK